MEFGIGFYTKICMMNLILVHVSPVLHSKLNMNFISFPKKLDRKKTSTSAKDEIQTSLKTKRFYFKRVSVR